MAFVNYQPAYVRPGIVYNAPTSYGFASQPMTIFRPGPVPTTGFQETKHAEESPELAMSPVSSTLSDDFTVSVKVKVNDLDGDNSCFNGLSGVMIDRDDDIYFVLIDGTTTIVKIRAENLLLTREVVRFGYNTACTIKDLDDNHEHFEKNGQSGIIVGVRKEDKILYDPKTMQWKLDLDDGEIITLESANLMPFMVLGQPTNQDMEHLSESLGIGVAEAAQLAEVEMKWQFRRLEKKVKDGNIILFQYGVIPNVKPWSRLFFEMYIIRPGICSDSTTDAENDHDPFAAECQCQVCLALFWPLFATLDSLFITIYLGICCIEFLWHLFIYRVTDSSTLAHRTYEMFKHKYPNNPAIVVISRNNLFYNGMYFIMCSILFIIELKNFLYDPYDDLKEHDAIDSVVFFMGLQYIISGYVAYILTELSDLLDQRDLERLCAGDNVTAELDGEAFSETSSTFYGDKELHAKWQRSRISDNLSGCENLIMILFFIIYVPIVSLLGTMFWLLPKLRTKTPDKHNTHIPQIRALLLSFLGLTNIIIIDILYFMVSDRGIVFHNVVLDIAILIAAPVVYLSVMLVGAAEASTEDRGHRLFCYFAHIGSTKRNIVELGSFEEEEKKKEKKEEKQKLKKRYADIENPASINSLRL